jgi:hypothetical protein
MNCFEHPQKPALGTCTFCGRGLCRDCASVVQGKLSCRGSCQHEVARDRELMQKSEQALNQRAIVYETSGSMYHQAFATSVFFGLLFVCLGAILLFTSDTIFGGILLGIGVILTIRGVGLARAGRSFKTLAAEGNEVSSQS